MKAPFATLALLTVVASPVDARQKDGGRPPDAAQDFLAAHFQLGARDFRDIDRRRPVTRTLETVDGREVATLGVVQIGAPASFYVDQLRDIVGFKKESPAVLQIGAFSTPARLDDVAALSLDSSDVEGLRRCRPGDCRVQLSADALERVRRDIPWGSPDAKAAADRTIREVLVDLVNQYRERGDAALMTYVDAERPLSLSSEFRSMIASRPAVLERFPDLYRHLLEFPRGSLADGPGISDIVYWSKEKMGPAVIISVTHLAIARLDGGAGAFAAASKQIYGSHYFDSSLGITILLETAGDREPGALLVYVNRSRLDALGGFWGGLKRAVVRSRTRSTMGSSLIEARDLVERRFRTLRARAG